MDGGRREETRFRADDSREDENDVEDNAVALFASWQGEGSSFSLFLSLNFKL